MIKNVAILIVSGVLCASSAMGQQEDRPVSVTEIPWSCPAPEPGGREEILRQLDWSWEELGPITQPEELNPGGKALPAYAKGRGNGTGRINNLVMHPSNPEMVWACSPTGGVWITRDNGLTWEKGGTDQLPVSGVSAVALDPKNESRWAVATGDGDDVFTHSDGIWLTEDGGKTFTNLNGVDGPFRLPYGREGDGGAQIGDVVTSPRKMKQLFVAAEKGLYKSAGALKPNAIRWEKCADGNFYDILYIRGKRKGKDIIVASGNKLVISFNGGRTWEEMPGPEYPMSDSYPFLRIKTSWSATDPGFLYASVTCSERASHSSLGEGTLQKFDLKKREWVFVRSLKKDMNNTIPTRARAFEVSPVDHQIIMCGNVQPLFRSVDGGKTFSRIEKNQMHDDAHCILFSPDGRTVWASHDGGVSVSFDGGLTFQSRDKGIGAANVFGVSVAQTEDPQVAFGGYDTGGNFLRDGRWWHVSWGDGFETITHPRDREVVFTTMQNGVIHRGEGLNFDQHKSASGTKTEWHTWIRMHPVYHEMIFCSGTRLMRSRNLGDSWEQVFDAEKTDTTLKTVYRYFLSAEHPGAMYLYVLDKNYHPRIWRSMNITAVQPDEIRWEEVTGIPHTGWVSAMVIDPSDPSRFWLLYEVTERNGKLFYFNGSTFEDQTSNLGSAKCESMILQKGAEPRLYIGSHFGVFTKKVGESQWTLLRGLPGTRIKSLDINYTAGKLVVGTFGRGAWWGDLVR